MSVFDPTTDQSKATVDGETNQGSFVDQLVAAKGITWKEPETIAKGKLEADAFIEHQKAQIAELEAKLQGESYSQALLQKLQESNPSALKEPEGSDSAKQKEDTTLDVETVRSLIDTRLKEQAEGSTRSANLSAVEKAMTDAHGANAQQVLQSRAKELNVTVDFLSTIAAQSPAAFLNLVGTERTSEAGHTTTSVVNTDSGSATSSVRNKAYYTKLRRENPSVYRAAATQDQMVADRLQLGERWV